MNRRVKQWVVVLGMTTLLCAGQASFDGLTTWANQDPGSSEGEANLDFARQPGQEGSGISHGSGSGQTDGIRQGADPNDFSVSSPRRPQVPTTEVPVVRPGLTDSIRTWILNLINRFAGMVRRS
ncbi:MAG: hypothetical protein FD129_1460 [bacterium]|nr:MAG: hypothetical protein FD129_1460 [bacterium]